MPKKRKTRQEKIIADLRRKLQTQVSLPANEATMSIEQTPKTTASPSTYTLPTEGIALKPSTTNYSRQLRDPAVVGKLPVTNYSYVVSDLKKTVLLTSIAIAVQVGLYLIVMR